MGFAQSLENAKRHVVAEEEIYYPVCKRYEVVVTLRNGREIKGSSHCGFDVARGKALKSVMEDLPLVDPQEVLGLPRAYEGEGVGSLDEKVLTEEGFDVRRYEREPSSVCSA